MRIAALSVLLLGAACAHQSVSRSDLDRVAAPAFISRVQPGAGPRSDVFRKDASYLPRLEKLSVDEADRRFEKKLLKGMGRFEVSERLRATTFAQLPKDPPWTDAVAQAKVAEIFQTYLLEEQSGVVPDYSRVREVGADSVVEFVIEEYGMRSAKGRAGGYLKGYGRMFTVDGRELWRREFKIDRLAEGEAALDPLEVAKDPSIWRNQMHAMLDAVAAQLAKDLAPAGAPARDRARPSPPAEDVAAPGPPGLEAERPGPPGLEAEQPATEGLEKEG